jgi:homoserine kinase type II
MKRNDSQIAYDLLRSVRAFEQETNQRIFLARRPTMLSTVDIAKVLAHYDIGVVESIMKAYRGFVNETVFIRTNRGRFVLRRNHRRLSEEAQRARHELLNWLQDRDVPSAPFIPTKDGETLLVLDGRSYEIMPFIEGTEFDPSRPAQLTSIGETLAAYPLATRDYPASPEEPYPRYSAQDVMALSERLLERDMMGDLYDDLQWYDTRAAKLRSQLPIEVYRTLPHVMLHGDVHRDNFLFFGDEVVALLDFDQAAWDARVGDIADALVGFTTDSQSSMASMSWGVYKGPIDIDEATRLLAAYNAVYPLSSAEIMALPIILELLWLQGELGRVVSTPEGAADYHLGVLGQGRMLSMWIQEHSEVLIERWKNLPAHQIRTSARQWIESAAA